MPGLHDARINAGTGSLNFPSDKVENNAIIGTASGSTDTSKLEKKVDDLTSLVTRISAKLFEAQSQITALEARIEAQESA